MALIDKHIELAQKIADALQGINEVDISVEHGEHGTQVFIENATFDFDVNGKSEGLTLGL